jgi:glutathione S-transferase
MSIKPPSLVLCELADPGIDGLESYSPFCLKVHRALRVAGLPYERRHGGRPDAFKAYNPRSQVPVLLVDGAPVCDSTAILERIEAMTGALTRGLDERQRAGAWLWEELADSTLSGFVLCARCGDERNWPLVREAYFGGAPWFVRSLIAPRIRERVLKAAIARDVWRAGEEACWRRYLVTLNHLEARAPERGFWVGSGISVADVALFAQLHSLRTPLTAFQGDMLSRRERLSAYLERVDAATREVRAAAPETARAVAPSLAFATAPS